jgi:Cdc6-like AAA superfamily ATPase
MSKQRTIIPANNLEGLYSNLEVYDGLSEENLSYYVPLFADKIKKLETTLSVSNAYNDTFYLLGQIGTGKTTVADYLFAKSEKLKSKYVFVPINFLSDNYSTDYYDPNFNTIELFLIIFARVFEVSLNYLDQDERKSFAKKLKDLEDKQKVQYKDIAQNHWSFADLFAEGLFRIGLAWNISICLAVKLFGCFIRILPKKF